MGPSGVSDAAGGSPGSNLLLVLELHPEDLRGLVGGLHGVGMLAVFVLLLGLRDQLVGLGLLLGILLLRRGVLELLDEQRALLGERDTSTSAEHQHDSEQGHRLLHRVVTSPRVKVVLHPINCRPDRRVPGLSGPPRARDESDRKYAAPASA